MNFFIAISLSLFSLGFAQQCQQTDSFTVNTDIVGAGGCYEFESYKVVNGIQYGQYEREYEGPFGTLVNSIAVSSFTDK